MGKLFHSKPRIGSSWEMYLSVGFYGDDSNDTKIIKYYIMHVLRLCIKLNSFVAHTIFAWSFSHDIAVPIEVKQDKYYFL